jgi:hypothetical protein
VQINDEADIFDVVDFTDEELKFETTDFLIEKYVDGLLTEQNKDTVLRMFKQLYIEALHVED